MHSLFSASLASKQLAVSDQTERTMKVTWTPAPDSVVNYRLKYIPVSGGKEVVLKIPGKVTSSTLKRLQPMTTYDITVLPIYKRGEGKARQGVGTTRTLVHNSTHRETTHLKNLFMSACTPKTVLREFSIIALFFLTSVFAYLFNIHHNFYLDLDF